jgi:hypothetical protein
MQKTARIYALLDEHGETRYVGSTGLNIDQRAAEHHRHRNLDDNRHNPELNAWLRTMERPPQAVLLQEVAWADRITAETLWTRKARALYGDLILNQMDGATPTDKLKEKRRVNKSGHYVPHTEEAKARISAGMQRSWAHRKAIAAEQTRLEQEMGCKLYRIPRTVEELRQQMAETDNSMAA